MATDCASFQNNLWEKKSLSCLAGQVFGARTDLRLILCKSLYVKGLRIKYNLHREGWDKVPSFEMYNVNCSKYLICGRAGKRIIYVEEIQSNYYGGKNIYKNNCFVQCKTIYHINLNWIHLMHC